MKIFPALLLHFLIANASLYAHMLISVPSSSFNEEKSLDARTRNGSIVLLYFLHLQLECSAASPSFWKPFFSAILWFICKEYLRFKTTHVSKLMQPNLIWSVCVCVSSSDTMKRKNNDGSMEFPTSWGRRWRRVTGRTAIRRGYANLHRCFVTNPLDYCKTFKQVYVSTHIRVRAWRVKLIQMYNPHHHISIQDLEF